MNKNTIKKNWNLLETSKENKYFLDRNLKKVHLSHPLLFYMLTIYSEGIDIRDRLDHLPPDENPVELPGIGKYSRQEIEYYYRKFIFLKENEYFTDIDREENLSGEINGGAVQYSLANTSQVILEVTDRCNCNCRYCWFGDFYSFHDRRDNKDMDIQLAKNILHYLFDLWNSPLNQSYDRIIYLTFYGGEPLLNFPLIREIVDYVKQSKSLRSRFVFSITTNGLLLDKYSDYLYENNFDLLVSLDGNEENNSYRLSGNGKPIYDTIIKNVNALRKKYPDYFSTNVHFISVLHNKNSVSEIYRYFKENFNKIPHIGPLNPLGVKESQKKDFWKTYANLTQSLYETEDYSVIEKDMFIRLPKAQDASIFLHQCSDFCFHDYNNLLFASGNRKRTPTGTCLPFSKKIYISVNGKILPCERIGQQFGLGTVTSSGVELDFEKIAEKYNNYFKKIREQCSQCSNADICSQCLFNIPSIDEDRPVCAGAMTETDYAKYISSIIESFEDEPGTFSKILREVVI